MDELNISNKAVERVIIKHCEDGEYDMGDLIDRAEYQFGDLIRGIPTYY